MYETLQTGKTSREIFHVLQNKAKVSYNIKIFPGITEKLINTQNIEFSIFINICITHPQIS